MYRISMKLLFTIILLILGLSGLTIYELINLNMIQIDFVPMDAKYLNGINEESMIYVLKSVGFFSLILSFSLIIIPVFIWKKDDESITKILVFLLLITVLVFEVISFIKEHGVSFGTIIEVILLVVFAGFIYGFFIIVPIIIIMFFINRKEEKYEAVVSDKDLLLYMLISYIISIILSLIINFIWLLISAAVSLLLGYAVGIIIVILVVILTIKIMSCMGTVYL